MSRTVPTPETITLHVPFRLQQRGGRKRVVTPDGRPLSQEPQIDNALVKALARAHRWQRMLESGEYASLTELAEAEKINRSYLSRVLRLTLLAPDLVEAIMDGRQGPEITLERLMQPMPELWEEQRNRFGTALPSLRKQDGRLSCPSANFHDVEAFRSREEIKRKHPGLSNRRQTSGFEGWGHEIE